MRPLCGIVTSVEEDSIVVKIRSGQTHTVKTKQKFSIRQMVVLLFDYNSLEVRDVVSMSYFNDSEPVTPFVRDNYEDDEGEDLEFFSFP